ncbi:hypothetical protein [Streptomyces syringium]|uniref:hypothetical protein n=1 Tax=Streptomyces syringium TaxID=76729 RepID=UPI003AAE2BE9
MQRQSNKHGPKKDDQLKKEAEHQSRSGRPTRSEEWRDPEALAQDEDSPRRQRPREE